MTLPPFGVPTGIEHEETPVMGLSVCSMPSHTTWCHDSRLTPFAWRPQLQLPMPMGNECQQCQQLHLQLPTPTGWAWRPPSRRWDERGAYTICLHFYFLILILITAVPISGSSMERPPSWRWDKGTGGCKLAAKGEGSPSPWIFDTNSKTDNDKTRGWAYKGTPHPWIFDMNSKTDNDKTRGPKVPPHFLLLCEGAPHCISADF